MGGIVSEVGLVIYHEPTVFTPRVDKEGFAPNDFQEITNLVVDGQKNPILERYEDCNRQSLDFLLKSECDF